MWLIRKDAASCARGTDRSHPKGRADDQGGCGRILHEDGEGRAVQAGDVVDGCVQLVLRLSLPAVSVIEVLCNENLISRSEL